MSPTAPPTHTATVIGGGPAGLMIAEVLASGGVAVTVHEHKPTVGRKLLLAGRGGLNITHSEPSDDLLARYGAARHRLEPAVLAYGPDQIRAWCAALGEPTFVGSTGRVFPASFRATPLLRAWLARLDRLHVRFALRDRWLGWAADGGAGAAARPCLFSHAGEPPIAVSGDVTMLALGGASWPRVGSDGTWVDLVRDAGVKVHDLRAANCGVAVAWGAPFADRFAGVPLKNVAIGVGDVHVRGDAMVTTDGLEGGPVYAHSPAVRDLIDREGSCQMTIDLHPDLPLDVVIDRLAHRRLKDSFSTAMRRSIGLSPVATALLRDVADGHPPIDAGELGRLVKAVPLRISSLMPIARAISSAGGIELDEVDDRFMLRQVPGTFVAGEMLDWEAPTGGYLLQATFSTAVAAANGALAWLANGDQTAAPDVDGGEN